MSGMNKKEKKEALEGILLHSELNLPIPTSVTTTTTATTTPNYPPFCHENSNLSFQGSHSLYFVPTRNHLYYKKNRSKEESKKKRKRTELTKTTAVSSQVIRISGLTTVQEVVGNHNNPHLCLWEVVFHRQASEEVRMHAVYCNYFLGFSLRVTGFIFGKDKHTIGRWVKRYESEGNVYRKERDDSDGRRQKVFEHHTKWLRDYVLYKDPLAYLHELQTAFEKEQGFRISASTISRILHKEGISLKTIERRAMEISIESIARFTQEVNELRPLMDQLLFLDEMSSDCRSMVRKKGWFLRKERPLYRGIFGRSKRISVLTFLGVDGVIENFETEGTFDRKKFFSCAQNLVNSGKVQRYPGKGSVWILDGAKIHCQSEIVEYLRLLGLKVLFLPPYCPFFMPIEVFFGMVKRGCRKIYRKKGTERVVLFSVISAYSSYDFSAIIHHCGWGFDGLFDPNINHDLLSHLRGDEGESIVYGDEDWPIEEGPEEEI